MARCRNFGVKRSALLLSLAAPLAVLLSIGPFSLATSSLAPPVQDFAIFEDQKSQGLNGGAFPAGVWVGRELNTTTFQMGTSIQLDPVTGVITLSPGNYEVVISAPAFRVNRHMTRFQNLTDSVPALIGTTEFSEESDDSAQTQSTIRGVVTVSKSAKLFQIQHFSRDGYQVNNLGFGIGWSVSGPIPGERSVFTTASVKKLR